MITLICHHPNFVTAPNFITQYTPHFLKLPKNWEKCWNTPPHSKCFWHRCHYSTFALNLRHWSLTYSIVHIIKKLLTLVITHSASLLTNLLGTRILNISISKSNLLSDLSNFNLIGSFLNFPTTQATNLSLFQSRSEWSLTCLSLVDKSLCWSFIYSLCCSLNLTIAHSDNHSLSKFTLNWHYFNYSIKLMHSLTQCLPITTPSRSHTQYLTLCQSIPLNK